ncbi:MAG: hypothetical protein HKN87_02545 [Saprospiraceae bacterium]|nr:hypothetical protein [Saprospiraceae bacterium]
MITTESPLVRLYHMTMLIFALFLLNSCLSTNDSHNVKITPNQFDGTDTERIQQAIDAAAGNMNKVFISFNQLNGKHEWILDSALLLPSDLTIVLDNCTLQLSDSCRDNLFRSGNVGAGITKPAWRENIRVIGIGDVHLKGANNPRSTGDGHRTLTLDPAAEKNAGNWRVSYGSDADKEGMKQKGDWRNIMILMSYVHHFVLKNVTIENAHGWAVSCERTTDADISDIRLNCPETQIIAGRPVFIANRDGINLRHGCKNFRINNISGVTGDDFIALSILGLDAEDPIGGSIHSTMVSSKAWRGIEDNTENVFITNIVCQSSTRGVAIRANDQASIHHVFVDGLRFRGGYNAMLIGGKGYGKDSQPGKIHNIHAMNISGDGQSLIQIEEAIADCSITQGVFWGKGDQIVQHKKIDATETTNVLLKNLVHL